MTRVYKIWIYYNEKYVKKFYGDTSEEVIEKYEMWLIKQPYDRNDMRYDIVKCHTGNKVILTGK